MNLANLKHDWLQLLQNIISWYPPIHWSFKQRFPKIMRSFTITTTSASTFELTYWLECWTAACPGRCAWRSPWCRLRRSRGSSSCASSACPANMLTLLLILPGSREGSCWRYIDGFLITGLVAVWPSVAQCWAWLPHLLMCCCCSYVIVSCCHAHLPQEVKIYF